MIFALNHDGDFKPPTHAEFAKWLVEGTVYLKKVRETGKPAFAVHKGDGTLLLIFYGTRRGVFETMLEQGLQPFWVH